MVTVRDYAEKRSVSVQAVYKQLKAHDEQLKGHIKIKKRIKYLDDYAVEYLTVQSSESPTVIMQMDQSDRIDQLERENRNMLLKITELQEVIIKKSEKIELLQEEKVQLLLGSVETKEQSENKWNWRTILEKIKGVQND